MTGGPERASLSRFDIRVTRVEVNGEAYAIEHPGDPEALIDEEAFARDERLPYWADIWPSSVALARRVRSMVGHGRTLIELGCGVGLVATAALRAGFDVTATDYYEEALDFTRANSAANAGRPLRTLLFDWRQPPGDAGRFDVVVASDVLYERPYGALVAQAIARLLAPDGLALVADPGRVGAAGFLDALAAHGLRERAAASVQLRHTGRDHSITLYEVSR